MMCIYLRTNKINGKQYVGQTTNLKQRENAWLYRKTYAGEAINNAREKYGTDNFTFQILRECKTINELNEWEKYYINQLNTTSPNGYNLTDGGEGRLHSKISEETRYKMSLAHSGEKNIMFGRTHTKEARDKIRYSRLGKKGHIQTEETKKKISETHKGNKNPNFGKPLSDKTKAKLSASMKGRKTSEETRRKMSEAAKNRWKKLKGDL